MTAPVTQALKPCPNPWCDGPEREGDFSPALQRGLFGNHFVACTSCCMDGPKRNTEAEAEAITARNHRHREAATAELVEALEGLVTAARATPRFASPMLLADALKALTKAKGEQP